MIITFLFAGDLPVALAEVFATSCRRWMPGVEVVQLTDLETPKLACADLAVRIPGAVGSVDLFEFRARHLAALEGEVLCLDYDTLVRRDVREVWDSGFDIAFTRRPADDPTASVVLREAMPHNLGVVFQRSGAFWHEVLKRYRGRRSDGWMMGQLLVSMMIKEQMERDGELDAGMRVLELPGAVYNHTPSKETDGYGDAAIVHFKGNRKHWMLQGCSTAAVEAARAEGLRVRNMVDRGRLEAMLAQPQTGVMHA